MWAGSETNGRVEGFFRRVVGAWVTWQARKTSLLAQFSAGSGRRGQTASAVIRLPVHLLSLGTNLQVRVMFVYEVFI